ncbi:hypothetical protein HK104_010133 [Borealophlyctis nickersoniae]|nr:hypothetical protein HK104_010133 [Borealophlyctis nickersoniae]
MTTIPPNQTLYVGELNDKVKKDELRRSLYHLFSPYGRILDIVALKTIKMRGQAFIVFRDIASATAALRSLQGFPFYDRPMKLSYAKSKSNAVKLMEGAYGGGSKTPKSASEGTAKVAGPSNGPSKRPREDSGDEEDEDNSRAKKQKEVEDMEVEEPEEGSSTKQEDANPPNSILFLRNLPSSITEDMLTALFSQYKGFKEVRLVPGKSDIAFVEYETEGQAETAKTVLDGFKINATNPMGVEFAKR